MIRIKSIFLIIFVLSIWGCKNNRVKYPIENDISKILFKDYSKDILINIIEQLTQKMNTGDSTVLFLRGIYFLKSNECEKALSDFNSILITDSTNSYAYMGVGQVYFHRFDYVDALIQFNKSIKYDPKNAFAYLSRTFCQISDKEKLSDFNKAIELKPDCAQCYLWRGILYDRLDSTILAIDNLNKSIELDKSIPLAYAFLGIIYESQGNYAEALKNYSLQIKAAPSNSNGYENKGDINYRLKNYERAIIDYKNAIKFISQSNLFKKEHFYYNIARNYSYLNKLDSVCYYLELTFDEDDQYVNYVEDENDFNKFRSNEKFMNLLNNYKK